MHRSGFPRGEGLHRHSKVGHIEDASHIQSTRRKREERERERNKEMEEARSRMADGMEGGMQDK